MAHASTAGASRANPSNQPTRSYRVRLLDLLVEHGPLDCSQASRLTGIPRTVVAATLHAARSRGMVSVVPRSQLPANHPCIAAGAGSRSFVYRFASYEPCAATPQPKHEATGSSFPEDVVRVLEDVFYPTMRASVSALGSITQRRRVVQLPMSSHDTMEKFVQEDGMRLFWVPRSQRTLKVRMAALRANGMAIQYLSRDELTEELCVTAVKRSWMALQFIPAQWRTLGVRLAAVRHSCSALALLSEHEQSPEVMSAAQASLASASSKPNALGSAVRSRDAQLLM